MYLPYLVSGAFQRPKRGFGCQAVGIVVSGWRHVEYDLTCRVIAGPRGGKGCNAGRNDQQRKQYQ